MKLSKDYSERFIFTDEGDWSVGMRSTTLDIDVIVKDAYMDMGDSQEFTKALKDFFVEYFTQTTSEIATFGEVLESEQDDLDDHYYERHLDSLDKSFY